MSYNSDSSTGTAISTIEEWGQQYKEQNIELSHEEASYDLVNPDDSLLVAGPSRLSAAADSGFYVIGVCQNVNISETSQIQPMKAIGSRRHLFSKTNTPVQISMGRAMFYGKNLARALYSIISSPFSEEDTTNNKYAQGTNYADSKFLTNLEEDLYRTPFGLGIIYHTPRTAHDNVSNGVWGAVGAEFAECCLIQSRSISLQAQQSIVMEQVQLVADRLVPWDSYKQEQ